MTEEIEEEFDKKHSKMIITNFTPCTLTDNEVILALLSSRKNVERRRPLVKHTAEADTFKPISVTGEYGLLNGLIDINRDILMWLIKIIGDEEKIRNIIGMSKIFFEWSRLPVFRWLRRSNIPLTFYLNRNAKRNVGYRENVGYGIVLKKEMIKGIFNIVFEGVSGISHLCGLVHRTKIKDIINRLHVTSGVCGIYGRGFKCGNEKVIDDVLYDNKKHTLMLELNLNEKERKGTLHVFIDGKPSPHAITNVPISVHFFFGTNCRMPIEVRSFRQLIAPSEYASNCVKHEWR